MEHKFYFLGGMPRSGSTLLCNVLAQNTRFYATHTSGCMDVCFSVRNQWGNRIEHKAHPNDPALQRVLQGILQSYYADIAEPVIIDKCRGWVSLIEMTEFALGEPIKILVPVRDVRDILTSFEKLWRENAKAGQISGEQQNYFDFQTVAGRIAFWSRKDQPVGLAYNRIQDAIARGFRDRMHFVHFEELTAAPNDTMKKIYRFLGEEPFPHNFEHVRQVTTEDDSVHGFKNLHKIRSQIRSQPSQWPEILGKTADKYATASFWRSL